MNLMSERDFTPPSPPQSERKGEVFLYGSNPTQGLAYRVHHGLRAEADGHENLPNYEIRRAELMRKEVETTLNSVKPFKEDVRADDEDSRHKTEVLGRSSLQEEDKYPIKYIQEKMTG
jgi:hypothetical protein